jgi:hypothetical protein
LEFFSCHVADETAYFDELSSFDAAVLFSSANSLAFAASPPAKPVSAPLEPITR